MTEPAAAGGTDWRAWHDPYDDPGSPLSQRLTLIQKHIRDWLNGRPDDRLRVVSVCAGQGRDLIEVLAERPDAARVSALLVERDPANVAAAEAAIAEHRLAGVRVRQADAGELAEYRAAVPADLVLLAGVLGNISDADVLRTVRALPLLCAPGALVIWTRTRRPPALTPTIRGCFDDAGFTELAFHAPEGVLFSVGVHQLRVEPPAGELAGRIFTFVR
jgi:hypothetical protein